MKKFIQFLSIALVAGMFTACGSDAPQQPVQGSALEAGNRGVQTVKFKDQSITIAADDVMTFQMQANAQQDAEAVKNIFNTLQAAENKAQQLDVQVTLSESEVKDGMFVFALESNESKNLSVELFDEEGFELAGSNKMDLTAGKNYKAINVKAFSSGDYLMRLRDGEGKELTQKFAVVNE